MNAAFEVVENLIEEAVKANIMKSIIFKGEFSYRNIATFTLFYVPNTQKNQGMINEC